MLTATDVLAPRAVQYRRSVLPNPQYGPSPFVLTMVRQFCPNTAASVNPVVVSTTPFWPTRANTRGDAEDVTERVPTGLP